MQSYRRIESDESFAAQIWEAEEKAPEWFRTASHVWTPDYDSFLKFWRGCPEIWGLFDKGEFIACVYLEFPQPDAVNIHVSVVREISHEKLAKFFTSLKQHKRNEGVKIFTGWVVRQNRHLLNVAAASGFQPTGLKMMYGQSRGRVLTWIEIRA